MNVNKLIDALGFSSEESREFVDVNTGEIVSVFSTTLRKSEYDTPHNEVTVSEQEERKLADTIVADGSDTYVPLPEQYEINEANMMKDFISTLDDKMKQDVLARAVHGNVEFRRFKDLVIDLDVAEQWNDFRHERYRTVAVAWCERNGIAYQ